MIPELSQTPLNTAGAITAIVHMIHGKQIRDVLPDVKVELDTAENSAAQDVVDAMEDEAQS